MAQFPIKYATELPLARSGAVRVSTNVDTGAAEIGKAVTSAASDFYQQEKAKAAKEYENTVYAETKEGQIAIQEYDLDTKKALQGLTDPAQIDKIFAERSEGRKKLAATCGKLPESRQAMDFYSRTTDFAMEEHVSTVRFNASQDRAYAAYDTKWSQDAKLGNWDAMKQDTEIAFRRGVITPIDYGNRIEKIPVLQHNALLNDIQARSQAAIGKELDEDKGYKVIDAAYKSDAIDAKERAMLSSSLNSFASNRRKQASVDVDVKRAKDTAAMAHALVDRNFNFGMLYASALDDKGKEAFAKFAAGATEEAPESNKPSSYNNVMRLIADVGSGKIGPTEAYNELLKTRYIGQNITDATFKWAIDKVDNPYDRELSASLAEQVRKNSEDYNGWWDSDEDRRKASCVNRELLVWVDNQVKAGKRPTASDLFSTSNILRNRKYGARMVGDRFERGGRLWEVYSVDEDGREQVFEVKDEHAQ